MVSVTVRTGPISATDNADEVPEKDWGTLIRARRSFLVTNIPYDCRNLLSFIEEAERHEMWKQTGYKDLSDLIRNGLEIDPDLAHWARIGLASLTDNKPISIDQAAKLGRAAIELANNPPAMTGQGKRTDLDVGLLVNNTKLERGSTNAPYLTARIARDHPEILQRMKQGDFKSVRSAAIEAGIIKPPSPFDVACKQLKKLNIAELGQLIELATQIKSKSLSNS